MLIRGGVQTMIYGNGSAGPFVAVSGSSLSSPNLQFTDFSVPTGVRLSTPSGAIVRATGAVSIQGNFLLRLLPAVERASSELKLIQEFHVKLRWAVKPLDHQPYTGVR